MKNKKTWVKGQCQNGNLKYVSYSSTVTTEHLSFNITELQVCHVDLLISQHE